MGIASSPLRDRVIFVEGAPRSGTTWLVTLLATHPDIAGVEAESHLFNYGLDHLFDNFEGRRPDLPRLQSYLAREQLVDLARDLCDGIFLAMRSRVMPGAEPSFVVEKTPVDHTRGERDLARKRECYPDAWYLHIVRDREAAARSLMGAPWLADRSYDTCAGIWDAAVGQIRTAFGDLDHYRELSYEELRADPAEALRPVFDWLGVASDEPVLEVMRVLSQQQFSDLGAITPGQERRRRPMTPRALASAARTRLQRRWPRLGPADEPNAPGSALGFAFVSALRERDAEALHALTGSRFELEFRGADLDLALRGDEARDALVRIANETFSRRYVREWWVATGALGEWWATAPGKPFFTLFLSALGGDAARVDVAICLAIEDDRIRRVVVISAAPPAGRPVATSASERADA